MDIFNGNRKLEEAVMYSIDWGIFLRHNSDGPIFPYIFLYDGEEIKSRVLIAEGDPFEYAINVLKKEEEPFQQFIIGIEGYLRDENDERVDAIIVQGFDKTQDKGVALGQMFEPKEKNGNFKKIGRVTFLGNPDLPVEIEKMDNPDYSVQEAGFTAMAVEIDGLTQYFAFLVHENPTVIVNNIKQFLRSKLMDTNAQSLNGRFELKITPGESINDDFLKFLVLNAVEEEKKLPHALDWEDKTGRKILLNIYKGDVAYLTEFENENIPSEEKSKADEPETKKGKYSSFTEQELNNEFNRIISIPNARTNVSALTDISKLRAEYEKRGIDLPINKSNSTSNEPKKPWWRFW